MRHEMGITRRELVIAGGGCICAIAEGGNRRACCITPELEAGSLCIAGSNITIDLAKAKSLAGIGSSVNILDPKRSLDMIVVHAGRVRYCALSGLCTHYPRPLTYIPSRRVLQCNNFNHSIFDLEGNVVKGPAPKPIRRYAVTVLRGRIEIAL